MDRSRREFAHDDLGARFDEVMNRYDLERRIEVVFCELLPESLEGRRLLDAGCGTGHFSRRAAERGARTVSLDLGFDLLRVTGTRCRTSRVQGDALRLPFPDGCFDVVVSSEMVEHTPDPEAAVAELCRVVGPGGVLALTTPNWTWVWAVRIADRLGLRHYHGLENWLGFRQLARRVEGAGLEIETHRGFHFWPFQFRPLLPLLRRADVLGDLLGPLAINQGLRAVKP